MENKIAILESCSENLKNQKHTMVCIETTEDLIVTKQTDPAHTRVLYWKLSELETQLSEYKDLLIQQRKEYKESLEILLKSCE